MQLLKNVVGWHRRKWDGSNYGFHGMAGFHVQNLHDPGQGHQRGKSHLLKKLKMNYRCRLYALGSVPIDSEASVIHNLNPNRASFLLSGTRKKTIWIEMNSLGANVVKNIALSTDCC